MHLRFTFCVLIAFHTPAYAQAPPAAAVEVTLDNFVRAETDLYFGRMVKGAGGVGKLGHARRLADIDRQNVIRMNRDTLYSSAVLDLDAGAATLTMPDAGARYMAAQVITQDHYTPAVFYGAGSFTIDRKMAETRYAAILIRTLIDPNDPDDLPKAHALQDMVRLSQASAGTFEVPKWDEASQKKVRDALLVQSRTSGAASKGFGAKGQVDPAHHLLFTARGWGGYPEADATYFGATPPGNDGTTVHTLKLKDVPVDSFWSVSVYNAEGYFEKNALNAYSINNLTARKSPDGSVQVQFGGCDGKVANCLPIMKGWNYTLRLYRPRAEILDGRWRAPEAVAVK